MGDRYACFGEVPLHGRAADDPRAFEPHLVPRLRIADVKITGHRIDDHVEQRRADAGVEGLILGCT